MTHIETITKGPNQRVRRTIAYRVVENRKELARFDIAPDDYSGSVALMLARSFMRELDDQVYIAAPRVASQHHATQRT